MHKPRKAVLTAWIGLLFALAMYFFVKHVLREDVAIHVGESVRDVLTKNPRHRLDSDTYFDDIPVIWPTNDLLPQTFNFIYDGGDGPIRFPHAKLVWARQYAGVVTDVLVGVSEKKSSLETLLKELQQTASSFQRAGWQQKGDMPTLASLRAGVEGVKTDAVQGGLMAFQKGSVGATLQIQGFSAEAGKNSQDSASYTLNVQFSDRALNDAQQTKTYKEHLRVKALSMRPCRSATGLMVLSASAC